MEILETKRLLLVPVNESHIKDIFENFNEKTYLQEINYSEETTNVVKSFIKQREEGTDYVYAITLKENNEFIGLVGLHNLKTNNVSVGIWTKYEAHGNHYGREAIGSIIKYAKKLNYDKLLYDVDRRNKASRKIATYYGGKIIVDYKKVETLDGRILKEVVYEIKIK